MVKPGKAKLAVFDEYGNHEEIYHYNTFDEALQDMPKKIGTNTKVVVNYKSEDDSKITCAQLEIREMEKFSWKEFWGSWWK